MKCAFKKWYTYVFMALLIGISVLVAIVPYFAINDANIWPKVFISYVLLFSAVIYIGGGFVGQDIYRAFKRKESKNWDYPLDQKYLDMAWKIYLPFLLSGFVLLISGLISYLFLK